MRKLLGIMAITICCIYTGLAQDNPENKVKDSFHLNGNISIVGRWQRGNFNQFAFQPGVVLNVYNSKHFAQLATRYHIISNEGTRFKSDLWISGLYMLNYKKPFFFTARGNIGFPESFRIDHIAKVGPGIGANLIEMDVRKFFQVHLYGSYVSYKYTGFEQDRSFAPLGLIRTMFPLFENKVNITGETTGFISTEDTNVWGIAAVIKSTFSLAKGFGFTASYEAAYNNFAPSIYNKFDGEMVFGVQYRF